MLAITTAADALGVPPDELQELITSGRLAATYDGDTWRVPDELLPAAAELLGVTWPHKVRA